MTNPWLASIALAASEPLQRTGELFLRVFPTMLAMRCITWMSEDVKLPLHSRRDRVGGYSKVNPFHLIGFMFNAVFNFSIKPLRLFSLTGAAILTLTTLLAVVYVAMSFITSLPPGITTVLLLLLSNLGLCSLGIGVLGEYIAKIYHETRREHPKRRAQAVVRSLRCRRGEANREGAKLVRTFEPDRLRRTILRTAYAGSAVHIACAFSLD